MKRSQIERIATLFAVWNDMILDGKSTPSKKNKADAAPNLGVCVYFQA